VIFGVVGLVALLGLKAAPSTDDEAQSGAFTPTATMLKTPILERFRISGVVTPLPAQHRHRCRWQGQDTIAQRGADALQFAFGCHHALLRLFVDAGGCGRVEQTEGFGSNPSVMRTCPTSRRVRPRGTMAGASLSSVGMRSWRRARLIVLAGVARRGADRRRRLHRHDQNPHPQRQRQHQALRPQQRQSTRLPGHR